MKSVGNRYVHGESGCGGFKTPSPEWASWRSMWKRCSKGYLDGVEVCEEWKDFLVFLEDMGRKPSLEHTLDREDNSLGYTPDNCRWATKVEQTRNRRITRILTFGGKTMTAMEWAQEIGIPYPTLYYRLQAGYPVKDALTKGVNRGVRRLKREYDEHRGKKN